MIVILSGMASTKEVPIPGPKGVPFLGNIYDIEQEVPLNSLELLADNYGTVNNLPWIKTLDLSDIPK